MTGWKTALGCAVAMFSAALAASASAQELKTVLNGIYTADQATRGEAVYRDTCARCHRDDLGGYSGLRGQRFIENWREDSLNSLWVRIAKTMPAGAPGSLKENEYLEVLAYILRTNDFPAGDAPLTAAQIPEIRFVAKEGAGTVPDFSLIETAGCLRRDTDGQWRLHQAAPPRRTRNPEASASSGAPGASAKPGEFTFRLLDGSSLKGDMANSRQAQVKGFLIRKPGDDRINPTSVLVMDSRCPN